MVVQPGMCWTWLETPKAHLLQELFYECDYKLRSWLTTDLSSDIETVSLGEKVDVVLAAQDSKLYKYESG